MELVAYIRLFRKWFWLILLGMFLAGGAAFLQRSRQPDLYQAKVTVLVGGFIEAPNPDWSQIQTGQDLAYTYAVLAKTTDILETTVQAGSFPVTAGQLSGALETRVVPDTSLLELIVTYRDPILAADMANELANQLTLNSPSNLTPEQQRQVELANAEIDRLNRELDTDRVLRSTVESQLQTAADPVEIERLRAELNTLANRINSASGNIAEFQRTVTSIQQRTNSLEIVERARIPTAPTGSSIMSITLLGAMVGAALAVGAALLIEYLDDTVRTSEEAAQIFAVPNLATISRFGKKHDGYAQRLIAHLDPGMPVSEEYRALRTNLLFSSDGASRCRGYVISSAGPSEGKSVTAANLAVTIANAGWQVLLVDADMRRPKIHEFFVLKNTVGLSTLLSLKDDPNGEDTPGINFMRFIQGTEIVGLAVMTSGHIPLNPTEMLGSFAMQRRIREIQESGEFDVILFDTPPALVVADGPVLASTLKLPIVLVIEAGETRRGAAIRTKERLDQLGIEVAGTVLNSANPKEQGYGYGYDYYYYSSEAGHSPGGKPRGEE